MAEPRDDKVSAAFRAMPRAEPPGALDDAIRAAARRAVRAKPESPVRRWAIPASVAAVLALSVGIALHVEWEKPLVVDGVPLSAGSAEYPAPAGSAEYPVSPPPVEEVTKPASGQVAKDAASENRPAVPRVESKRERKEASPTPATPFVPEPAATPSSAPVAATPAAPASAETTAAAPPAAALAPRPSPAQPARSAPSAAVAPSAPPAAADMAQGNPMALRAKREGAGASLAKEAVAVTPEKQLERIGELRAAGRHAEADEALAKFRREHPDYRIPPELWEKVKPR